MGNSIWDLFVNLGIDTKAFETGVDKAVSKSKSSSSELIKNMSMVGGAVAVAGAAAVGAAVTATTGFIIASVKAASDAQDIQAQLGAVLQSTGGKAGVTAQQVNDLATAFGNTTKFEDDVIVSGQNMLLTFTNIGKNVFPAATETMLNMAQAMGGDLQGSAIQLGKALNDPTQGIGALSRVGVTFTDEQKKMIESLQKAGKLEEAQAIILKELQTEFGGAAKAAGSTFAGKLTILKNSFGNIQETIGTALLPTLTTLTTRFSEWVSSPAVQTGIQTLAANIAAFAVQVITYVPLVVEWFTQVSTWFINNQGVIVGILAALGASVVMFVFTTTIPALIAMATAFAPVLAVMAAVGVAAYLLYQAWTSNFGGMRDYYTALWEGTLKPAFTQLWTWLQTNIPTAITWLSNVWNTVFIPALTAVWAYLTDKVYPVLKLVADFIAAAFSLAVTAVSVLWTNVLLPAFTAVADYLGPVLMPAFQEVEKFMNGPFMTVARTVATFVSETLSGAFNWLTESIGFVIGKINDLREALLGVQNISLPNVSGGNSVVPPEGRASGGPVVAGRPYIVGEKRAELFIPDENGRIVPNVTNNYSFNYSGNSTGQQVYQSYEMARITG